MTLVPEADEVCAGVAYCIDQKVPEILEYLDHREQGGYQRHYLDIELLGDSGQRARVVNALVYVADQNNALFTGVTELTALIDTINKAVGPSGSNRDYVMELAEALVAEGIEDSHVSDIANQLCC